MAINDREAIYAANPALRELDDLGDTLSAAEHASIDHTSQLGVFVPDSFITVSNTASITVANQWTLVTNLTLGPQNYDLTNGADMALAQTMDSIDVFHQGRYRLDIRCQLSNPTADGWFESAIEPNGLTLSIWPSDLINGHNGTWIPMAAAGFTGVSLGFGFSMTTLLAPGSQVSGWIRYLTSTGVATIDVQTILSIMKVTL